MMNRILDAKLLGAVVTLLTFSVAADYVRENELDVEAVVQQLSVPQQVADLRTTFPVASLDDEALKGLMYSANSWARGAAADETRKATITAQAGTLADGVFMPDGSAELTVLPATTGEGTVDWALTEITKKIYRLTHTSRKGGTVDDAGTCYGYLDFTHCVSHASQEDVEAAVLGAITHKIAVVQDAVWPWQPPAIGVPKVGIATDEGLTDETTTTAFTFEGCGVFRYEYALGGGTLSVLVDGVSVETLSAADDWQVKAICFGAYGTHTVVFSYTAAGDGETAALRGVQWEMDMDIVRAQDGNAQVRVDLREGVRTPRRMTEVLPFTYSSTNWIGDVVGVSAASVARVAFVQLTGDDDDVTTWTEVPGTASVLVNDVVGEGEKVARWKPKDGVWKATFDILNGNSSIHQETAFFDLRLLAKGMLIIFK